MKDREKSRKQLAKEVKQLRAQLAAWERRGPEHRPAGNLLADLVVILDRGQRFVAVTGPWLERFALSADLFLGKPVADFLDRAAAARFDAAFRRVLAGREEVYDCPWLMPPPAEARHLQIALAPLRDAQGLVGGVVGVARDLTEGVRLGEGRFQEYKLEALGRMASGVAHHLNNLLTPVLGFAELLLRSLPPDDPTREYAEQIRTAADRTAALLRPLQAFVGAQAITPQEVDLNALLEELSPVLRSMLGASVRLVLSPGPGLWPVRVDPAQLGQVLFNLAMNAREAMPEGGVFTLATANTAEGWVTLAVSDTGAGMSDTVRERLFEPFFTTKAVDQGPGLGLAVVYGIVKQSGGRIEVASRPGRGTTFTISLPRA